MNHLLTWDVNAALASGFEVAGANMRIWIVRLRAGPGAREPVGALGRGMSRDQQTRSVAPTGGGP